MTEQGRIRVLHVYKTFWPDTYGGVETYIDTLARSTVEHVDHTVLVLSRQPDGQANVSEAYRVVRGKMQLFFASTAWSWSVIAQFRQLAREADIIHYHVPNPMGDVMHWLGRASCPFIVTYHADVVKQRCLNACYRPALHAFLRRAAAIVTTSPKYLASSSVLQKHRDRCRVIAAGIDHPVAASAAQMAHWQARFPTPFFLFLGTLRYYKGLHCAIQAVAGTGIPLVIAGCGAEEATLKAQVRQHQVKEVTFLGSVTDEDRAALLRCCHALVLPSHLRSEAFGLVLLEAAACARPLISCEIGTGTSYVNQHRETGLVVAPSDALALREAMTTLYQHPDVAEQYGQQAYRRYCQYFTAQKQGEAFLACYQQVLATGE